MSSQRATRTRGQLVAAISVLASVLAAGSYVEAAGPAAPDTARAVGAPSGAWFCPHGGGPGWEVTLELANPGREPVDVRVTHLSTRRPAGGEPLTVPAGAQLQVPFRANDRGSGTFVEFFGGWIAAGWVAHAGGDDSGVAAEPCADAPSRRWYLPDAATMESDDAWLVVMNPFSETAVVSLSLFVEGGPPIRIGAWTNVPIKPFRAEAFHLNQNAEGYEAVGTLLDVPGGRVAAATLGLSSDGGARSTIGQPEATGRSILPASFDQGRSDLFVMNTLDVDADVTGSLFDRDVTASLEVDLRAIRGTPPAAASSTAYQFTTEGPSTVDVTAPPSVAFARRTFGVSSDQGSTVAAEAPDGAWVLLPAVAAGPSKPGLALANPGDDPADVTLSFLPSGTEPPPKPIEVTIPAGRTINAPREFLERKPRSAVLAVASTGTFVPAFASYSLGREGVAGYAVSLGVRVPSGSAPPES